MTNTNNTIRRPSEIRLGKKITKLRDKFYVEHGYYATDDTIMELVERIYGIKIKDKSDVTEINVSSVSEPLIEEGYNLESDTAYNEATSTDIDYEKSIDKDYNREVINNVLEESGMNEKNIDIIKMLFGIGYDRPYTLTEVGEKYNLEERVVNEVKNLTIQFLKQNRDKYSLAV
jgi:DNA-directed RNA polymerase sigma subunit (sigma70/sigma32)